MAFRVSKFSYLQMKRMNDQMKTKQITLTRFTKQCIVMFLITCLSTTLLLADTVVVANAGGSDDAVASSDIKNIYLGKKTKWSDGTKVVFVTLKSGDAHKAFLKQYVKKTPAQFKNYWGKLVFTGKGKAPKSFSSEEKMLAYISKTKGAVGYVSSSTKDASSDGRKVITIK